MGDLKNLPEGWVLDDQVPQLGAEHGYWWVITDKGLRTSWNGEGSFLCPVCRGNGDLVANCDECSGRGLVDHIPYAERPWDEVTTNLWLGGHHCQPSGAPGGNCYPADNFDMVVSLHQMQVWDFAEHGYVPVDDFDPVESVKHIRYKMADADLDPEHHTALDRIADQVKIAVDKDQKVLVRCQAGINRGALVTGLSLIKMGWKADEAITRMREVRSPYVLFNESFESYLREVETRV